MMTPQAWAKFKRSIGDLRFEHYVSLVLSQRTIKPLSLTRRICRGHSSPLHPGEQKFSDPLSNLASTEKRNPLKLQSLCKACWKDKHKLCSLKTQSNWIAMSFAHLLGEGVCVCVCVHINLVADVRCPLCFLTRGLSLILKLTISVEQAD